MDAYRILGGHFSFVSHFLRNVNQATVGPVGACVNRRLGGKLTPITRKKSGCDDGMPLKSRIINSFSETFRTLLSPLTVFIWLASIILATIAGPFETYLIMDWPARAQYWLLVVSVSIVVGYGVRATSLVLIGPEKPLLLDSVMVTLMTLVFTPIVWLITRTAQISSAANLPTLPSIAGYVMLCTAVIVIGRRVTPGFEAREYDFFPEIEVEPPQEDEPVGQPRLLRRLAVENRGKILRLTANDHFVEVATENGAESLRMRLIDAIDEMEPVRGYCVHRSHWVAHKAIIRVERESNHKIFVLLANNDRIPVSRKYRENVEEAGLI
ncbi:LytTR family DNA-binding domain-containing protein [uncultured Roseovarius sp.]|uniref:LytTR family DNA-binding domain-containing protein n=1 Tax=uncultured Roseovarius sp. TaxID=293344 RepID=UPI00261FD303|nr:LytTR family DNA-binding domain-containing protein [uncultured Roseovarius sp.]